MLRRGEETKERIERTALRLFVEQGVTETSIKEIARAAGISQGAMYNHYVSKEDLAWSLFAENFSDIGQELRRRAREHTTIEARLKAMVAHVFASFDRDWLRVSYVFAVRHLHLGRVTRKLGNPYMVFRTVIAEAIKRGEIPRQDPELATSLVTGAVIQVIDTRILGRIAGPLADRSDEVASACMRLLRR